MGDFMSKYKLNKYVGKFHICKGMDDVMKIKYQDNLRQNYNIEISYELLLENKHKK